MTDWKWLKEIEFNNEAFRHWHEKNPYPDALSETVYPTIKKLIDCIDDLATELGDIAMTTSEERVLKIADSALKKWQKERLGKEE